MLGAVRDEFGLAPDAEVTTEANPDSVGPDDLRRLADGGFTRVSFGMQSAVPHVLAALDRTHDPDADPATSSAGRATRASMSASTSSTARQGSRSPTGGAASTRAIAERPDHLSAYALIVEDGTKLARQIRRGELAEPDDDLEADMYELADELLGAAGYEWYEVSNWATDAAHRSRHNLGYWRGDDWWGVGPGAHSHVGGVRWWNAKHPAAYAERVTAGLSPAVGRETPRRTPTRETERVLLLTRIREGIAIPSLHAGGRHAVAGLIADDLVDAKAALAGVLTLTRRGRLLADAVVRRLLED